MNHEKFMKIALQQAQLALDNQQVPISCVIVRDGEVIAQGYNLTSKSPIHHAELVAMNNIDTTIPFDLYVTVEPCIMCASALMQTNVNCIYYGASNSKFGGCGGVVTIVPEEPWKQLKLEGGIMENEAIELLKQFFERPNEKKAKM
ncbi:Cytosine_deaminase [Hexamita inflata]|uniref:Putative n=1 Tax=Hexamita inflata TaxID=28002 RepID=A0AA86QK79_9EUKA|nr:Cytosine deaminase [Hexamita inflata]